MITITARGVPVCIPIPDYAVGLTYESVDSDGEVVAKMRFYFKLKGEALSVAVARAAAAGATDLTLNGFQMMDTESGSAQNRETQDYVLVKDNGVYDIQTAESRLLEGLLPR